MRHISRTQPKPPQYQLRTKISCYCPFKLVYYKLIKLNMLNFKTGNRPTLMYSRSQNEIRIATISVVVQVANKLHLGQIFRILILGKKQFKIDRPTFIIARQIQVGIFTYFLEHFSIESCFLSTYILQLHEGPNVWLRDNIDTSRKNFQEYHISYIDKYFLKQTVDKVKDNDLSSSIIIHIIIIYYY